MARPRRVQHTLKAKSQKTENKSTAKDEHETPSAALLTPPKGFLDLPPELRNAIYRLVLIKDEPVRVQCERVPSRTVRYRFTMIPALTLVSKQLRLETQRIFMEGNEFLLTPNILKLESEASLLALSRMHKDVGLDLKALQVNLEVKKRCDGDLYSMTADYTIRVVNDKITVTQQAYGASYVGRRGSSWPPTYVPHVGVCDCKGRMYAESLNGRSSKSHNLVACVQQLKPLTRLGTRSYHSEDMRRTDEVILHAYQCVGCSAIGAAGVYFRL